MKAHSIVELVRKELVKQGGKSEVAGRYRIHGPDNRKDPIGILIPPKLYDTRMDSYHDGMGLNIDGIARYFPTVWDAIKPDDMSDFEGLCLIDDLMLMHDDAPNDKGRFTAYINSQSKDIKKKVGKLT